MSRPKIAIVLSHPIQHFCPMYVNWAKNSSWSFKVFFASSIGVKKYFDPNFKREIIWSNLHLDQFDHEFLNDAQLLPIDNKLDAPELDERLRNYGPDAVLVYGYIQKIQRRAYGWAKNNKVKIFYFSDSELRHHRILYKKLIKKIILRKYFSNIDAFLSIGDANEEYYRYYGVADHKLFRSAYPIDIELYEQAFNNKNQLNLELRDKLKIPIDNIVLTVVGKLVDWKRQVDLIKAVKVLDNNYKNLTALIIGTGIKADEWKREAGSVRNNQIIFTDFIAAHELPNYYAATDIYIHTSEIEPHSVAISEAIYMGCPLIISDRCGSYGPNDDLQVGYNGFIYNCGDIIDLSRKLERLIKEESLRNYFSTNSRKYAIISQHLAHVEGLSKALINLGPSLQN